MWYILILSLNYHEGWVMGKKFIEFLSAVIPFIDSYPPWVKICVAVWIIGTAALLVCLLFFRIPSDERKNSQRVEVNNSPNVTLYQAGRDIIVTQPSSAPPVTAGLPSTSTLPDVKKAIRETIIVSRDQLKSNPGLVDVSREVPGYFELSVSPTNDRYSPTSVETKSSFGTHFFASVHIAGLEGAGTLEFQGRDVWFAIDAIQNAYFVYESEENWTHWRSLNVIRQPNINNFGIYQNGRSVSVFLNGQYVASFTKFKEPEAGPIGVGFKAYPSTGGKIHFQRLSVWEF